VATDDLHAPLGLDKPAGRPIVHSVAAAVLGITTAAVVIGATIWYGPLARSLPTPAPPPATPVVMTPEPTANAPTTTTSPRVSGTGVPARAQVTGSIPPAGGFGGKALDPSQDTAAAPGRADRVITIIDGRSGARQEVRIPAGSDAENAPAPDPGLANLMHDLPSAEDVPAPQPPRAKPPTPQKRATKPVTSTNSASQAPLR
jgi:hypothetical protein